MKHDEMLRTNSVNVFDLIARGKSTVLEIKKELGLSHTTIDNICASLIERNLLFSYKEKQNKPGRRNVIYEICPSHYTVYIEETNEAFNTIFINANNYAIERYEYPKRNVFTTNEYVERLDRAILARTDYERYCRGIFIYCCDDVAQYLPPYFTRTTPEMLITDSFKNDNEIMLFDFESGCILSINGRIIPTNARRKGVERVFKPDRYLKFTGILYNAIFVALQKHTIREMRNLI